MMLLTRDFSDNLGKLPLLVKMLEISIFFVAIVLRIEEVSVTASSLKRYLGSYYLTPYIFNKRLRVTLLVL